MNYLNILIKGNFNKWGGENNFVRKLYFYYQKNILIINIIEYVYIYIACPVYRFTSYYILNYCKY